MIVHMNRFLLWMAAALTTLCLHGTAWAALPEKPGSINNAPKPYAAYAIGFVLIAAVCVAVFKSAKRTHLD